MKTLNVEILAPGEWSGSVGGKVIITDKTIDDIVASFTALKEFIDVPLKFGHNKKQQMTDGLPAIGWIDSVWKNEAGKLMAKFTNLPKIVSEAFSKKLYRNVSIEALFDVKHKGEKYGTVLTAVALLGADMPAVNTLSDLQTYMSAGDELQFDSRSEFSTMSGSINEDEEDNDMTELEKALAEVERLKGINSAQGTALELSAKSGVDQTSEITKLKAEAELRTKETAKVEFGRRTEAVKADLEDLVKSKTITPAKRDELVKDFTEDTAGNIEFAVASFKDMAPAPNDKKASVKGGDPKSEDGEPDELLDRKATKLSAESNLSYEDAVTSILESEPELARDYLDQLEEA